ncbi:MAG: hypothetical protein JWP92_3228 [Caulobacter sp.]|nr:hypothetical protein [Caulobacter sp.]
MTRLASLLFLAASLVACSREPRSASYFDAHRQEAAKVVAACKAGAHRGDECLNAQFAMSNARREARMERYRRVFEGSHD